ncbi:hypothetical protein Tsubulata_035597 [Turnera subulata]|uniref:Translation initiation factor IF2/IF5 domain-containing protein n=1 Tax=Turnera subulata TaxID=218843 RepID=A0A9Q0GCP8_9ROSI|nr:hypothetical protein Tsubulata_035597 [Turnera subulata]
MAICSSTDDSSSLNTTASVAGGHGDDGINRLSRLSMRWRESRLSGMRWRESSPDNEEDEETIRRRKRRRERMMWDGSSSSDDDEEEEEEEEEEQEEDEEEEATRRRRGRRAKWKRRVQPPKEMKEQREPFPIDHHPDDLLLEILLRAPSAGRNMKETVTRVEGEGPETKTCIDNMEDIADALGRTAKYLTKYLGTELGCSSGFDKETGHYFLRGRHDPSKLDNLLDDFIKNFVRCYACGHLQTQIEVDEDDHTVALRCADCDFVWRWTRERTSVLSSWEPAS